MEPSKCGRIVIGLDNGGRIFCASGSRFMPRPGPVGMSTKPFSGSGTLSTTLLPKCAAPSTGASVLRAGARSGTRQAISRIIPLSLAAGGKRQDFAAKAQARIGHVQQPSSQSRRRPRSRGARCGLHRGGFRPFRSLCEPQSFSLLQVVRGRCCGSWCTFRRRVSECPGELVCRHQCSGRGDRRCRAWPRVLRAGTCLFASCTDLLSAGSSRVLPAAAASLLPPGTGVLRAAGAGLLRAGRALAPSPSPPSGLGRLIRVRPGGDVSTSVRPNIWV